MAWTRVVSGEKVKAVHVNDIQQALDGTAGKGQVMSFTDVEDAANYALSVKNKDATNSLIARFLNAAGAVVLSVVKEAVNVSKQIVSTVADGTAPFVVASTTKVDNLHVERAGLADDADTVDGVHAGTDAGEALVLDGNGYVPLANLNGITHAQMANRTRTLWVPALGARWSDYVTPMWTPVGHATAQISGEIYDNYLPCVASAMWPVSFYGSFVIPTDAVSVSVQALLTSGSAAGSDRNISVRMAAWHKSPGSTIPSTSETTPASALELPLATLVASPSLTLTDPAPGELVRLRLIREAENPDGGWTGMIYVFGFLVTYTADM
jgi:hypothetical protein